MHTKKLLATALLAVNLNLLLSYSAFCGEVHATAKPGNATKNARTKYDALLEALLGRVKSKDPSLADEKTASKAFKELRFAYTETQQYHPYGDSELTKAMVSAFEKAEYKEALQYAEKMLKKNGVDIRAHMVASVVYRKTGDQEKADYHKTFGHMLIVSILSDGCGDKPETAMEVISTEEEHAILNYKWLLMKSQEVVQAGEHIYDKLTVVDPKSGKTSEIYFCVDKLFKRLSELLDGEAK